MTRMLKISKNLHLPLEVATQSIDILAIKGAGKTNTGKVLCEQMLEVGIQVVIADPVGAWWGLRSSADGKRKGYPITIFGGDHGDAPLENTSGALIADFIVDENISAILDLSGFPTKAERVRFMTKFTERLFYRKKRNRSVLHLFLDEADEFAPQKMMVRGAEMLLHNVDQLVRRGRMYGIGTTMITQRPAVLNKNVLTQAEVLIALRTLGSQDRKAINDWIDAHGTVEQKKEMHGSLASLPTGTAWVWAPGKLDIFKKVKIFKSKTFDSSATPTVGKKMKRPKKVAKINLDKLIKRMADSIEEAKANDPEQLKKRLAKTEQALEIEKNKRVPKTEEKVKIKTIKKLVVTDKQIKNLGKNVTKLLTIASGFDKVAASIHTIIKGVNHGLALVVKQKQEVSGNNGKPVENGLDKEHPFAPSTLYAGWKYVPVNPRKPGTPPAQEGDTKLSKREEAILAALAPHLSGRNKSQVAIMSGYKKDSSSIRNGLSSLRNKGLINGTNERLMITLTGKAVLGEYKPLPKGKELLEWWLNHKQIGRRERLVLEALASVYPNTLTRAKLSQVTEYDVESSSLRNALSKLRMLGLVSGGKDELRAAEEFFN